MLFFSRFIISFFACCILWWVAVYTQLGNLTKSSKWVYEVYDLKEAYAKKIKENKVVIVSGSNSLFGFDSKKLQKSWGLPVVNGAVHAGLGLPYILYKSKSMLNEGDIVLLPLEYSFYQAEGKPSAVYSDYILSRDTPYFNRLSYVDRMIVMSSLGVKRLFQGIMYDFNGELMKTEGVYGVQNVNVHGDQINIESSKMTKGEFAALNGLHADLITNPYISQEFINHTNSYFEWAKEHGVCIIVMPPNHMFFKEYEGEMYTKFLSNIKGYYASRDIAFLGSPTAYMYDKEYYFNTSYHLNASGVQKRTNQVIDDIGGNIGAHCKILP